MRLHLPKGLLAAILAACLALPAGAEGETETIQYGWSNGAPATSRDNGANWTPVTYDSSHTLENTTGPISFSDGGNFKITGIPEGGWSSGTSVICSTVTGDDGSSKEVQVSSAWFCTDSTEKRIYMTGDNISKMDNIFLTGVHFVVGTDGTQTQTHSISSNLFLGEGKWRGSEDADVDNVHYKAALRTNVDANISGNVSLTSDNVHISTWAGTDITFGGALNGENKALSIGAEAVNSVINLNGKTSLGSLTVGCKGDLTELGKAISVVVGESATAELGNVTLMSSSTLTNNGTLSISGTYTGSTINQSSGASLTLKNGAVVRLDALGFERIITETQTSTFGTYKDKYTLANGGAVSIDTDATVNYTLGGNSVEGNLVDTVYETVCSYYNIVTDDKVDYSTITSGGTSIDFIRVAGTLTSSSDVSHDIMLVGGALQGTGTYSGGISMSEDSSVRLNGNMSLTGTLTATQGKTLSVLMADGATSGVLTIGTGSAVVSSDKVGKLDGATLQICDGVTVNVSGHSDGNAQIAGAIVVQGGGTLNLTTADTLGYKNGTQKYTKSITLEGSSTTVDGVTTPKLAKLDLTATQTLTTSLNLNGNSEITGSAMSSFEGEITASGTNNVIKNELQIRKNLTITVNNTGDSVGSLDLAGKLGVFYGFYGVLTKAGDGTLIISGSDHAYNRSIALNAGTLELRSALSISDLTGSGTLNVADGGSATLKGVLNGNTVKNINVKEGGSLILDGGNPNGNYAGTITVDAGGKMLATNNGNYNIVNGGNGKLVLNGEFTIETTNDTNNVNGISGSGVVKTAQNATLNVDGAGSFTGSVESSGGSGKSVTLAFAEGTTATLKSLSATNGSTLNAKGIAGYSVTTDSDSGAVTTTGGLSVSELVIGTGSTVQAWTGTGNYSVGAEATVVMSGAEGSPVTLTVGTAGQTGTSTLNANLVLDGATVTLNNALAMGSTLTLNDITLSMSGLLGGQIAKNTTIQLFTGVDSLTLGTRSASAAAITVEDNVDAGTVFSNLGTGNFLLTYTGGAAGSDGIVSLVAKRDVPEPTTATLSLLALMGLAARRRRRKA